MRREVCRVAWGGFGHRVHLLKPGTTGALSLNQKGWLTRLCNFRNVPDIWLGSTWVLTLGSQKKRYFNAQASSLKPNPPFAARKHVGQQPPRFCSHTFLQHIKLAAILWPLGPSNLWFLVLSFVTFSRGVNQGHDPDDLSALLWSAPSVIVRTP